MSDADARGPILSAEELADYQRLFANTRAVASAPLSTLCDAGLALLVHVEAREQQFNEALAEEAHGRAVIDDQLAQELRHTEQLTERLVQADAARLQLETERDELAELLLAKRRVQRKADGIAQAERITHLVNLEYQRLRVDEDTADALTCFLKWDQTPELTLDADTISAMHDLKASFKKYRTALAASPSTQTPEKK